MVYKLSAVIIPVFFSKTYIAANQAPNQQINELEANQILLNPIQRDLGLKNPQQRHNPNDMNIYNKRILKHNSNSTSYFSQN